MNNKSRTIDVYKGISTWGGLDNWPVITPGSKGVITPGFLGNYDTAVVYSEPNLTGKPKTPSIIAKFQIKENQIEDRTAIFNIWANKNNRSSDVSVGFPIKWTEDKSIWTVKDSGSGHERNFILPNITFVYCGVFINYVVHSYYADQSEWENEHIN